MVTGKVADLLRESRLRAEASGGDFTAADKAPIAAERPSAHGEAIGARRGSRCEHAQGR